MLIRILFKTLCQIVREENLSKNMLLSVRCPIRNTRSLLVQPAKSFAKIFNHLLNTRTKYLFKSKLSLIYENDLEFFGITNWMLILFLFALQFDLNTKIFRKFTQTPAWL